MPRFFCWFFLTVLLAPAASATESPKAGQLAEKLALVLPGNSQAVLSARLYAETELKGMIVDLRKDKVGRRSLRKSAQRLERYVLNRFLRRHDGFASFEQLFKDKTYSQATAVALYAILAEEFGYTYAIRSDLWSLSILLDPMGESITLAIPLPKGNATVSKQAFQQNYLDLLRASGLLSEQEWQRSPDDIFARYYYGETDKMTFRQLAGYLQYLEALGQYRLQRHDLALWHIEQAQLLYNRPVHAVLRRAILFQLAVHQNNTTREGLYYLFLLWEEKPDLDLRNDIVQRYINVADDYLLKQKKEVSFDSLHQYFQRKSLAHPDLAKQLREIYFLKKAAFHASQSRTTALLDDMDSLYQYRPTDPDVQHILATLLVWSLRGQRDWKIGLPSVTTYAKRFPFLSERPEFKDLDLFYRAEQIRYFYDADDPVQGLPHLQAFETLLLRYGPTPRHKLWILTAYLGASNYYFRLTDYANARYFLDRAYLLSPDDPYLQHRRLLLLNY